VRTENALRSRRVPTPQPHADWKEERVVTSCFSHPSCFAVSL
jgi:hypothetical protein